MSKLLTVGELTLDSVIVEGESVDWAQRGGGALYSAVGARLWAEDVAICATVGHDYESAWLDELAGHGLDVSAVTRIEGGSLGLWLLYEGGGRRHQVVKQSASSFATLDTSRRDWAESVTDVAGVHVAPQTAEGQRRELDRAVARSLTVTQDLLIEPFIDVDGYRDGRWIRGADVFLPSQQEVDQIWGPDMDPGSLRRTIHEVAGVATLVLKRGAGGTEVHSPSSRTQIPSAVREVRDPTGAGDAFCGGFLAGLVETGDVVEAAVRGSVSAALVVETRDAIGALEHLASFDRNQRATDLRSRIQKDAS